MKYTPYLGGVISFLLFVSCATTEQPRHSGFTRHYERSLFKITEEKLFSVELLFPEGRPKTGKNEFDLIVHDSADRDVVGATISVEAFMPETGQLLQQKPTVEEKGGGLYHVSNFHITMPGHWQILVTVEKGGLTDRAVFDLPQVGKMQMHRHIKRPERIDTSRRKTTEKGLYVVSYVPEIDQIRTNTLHSWRLTISDSEGNPVRGATIRVEGDMPEHGHGMPTEPQVVDTPSPGVYIIDGFKFHMPGWWVIKFHIKSDRGEDVVSFQLDLK